MSSKKVTALTKSMAEMQLEDAPQKPEVPRKNLLSPDARRISNIMENCIAQAKIAINLPAIIQWISVSGIVIDEKFSRAIEKHNRLSEIIESAGEQKEDAAWAQVKEDFKNTVKGLLRFIKGHPHVISGWEAQPPIELGEEERKIIRGLEEFHDLMVERMLTSEKSEDLTEDEKIELEQLIIEEKEMDAALKELDEKIAQKACELEALDQKKKAQQAAKRSQEKLSQPGAKSLELCRLQEEVDQAQLQLDTLVRAHKAEERILTEKNKELERQIEDLIQDFDTKMAEMTAKIEENQKGLEREEEELRQLEKPFAELEVEYNKVMEKRRLAEEKRKEAEEKRREEQMELELKTKAAVIAQAWWRGHSTRKALKNESKSKKPPKKGKGKKTK